MSGGDGWPRLKWFNRLISVWFQMPKPSPKQIAGLITAACLMAAPVVATFEGKRNTAYLDHLPSVSVWTICYGSTGSHVTQGQVRTDADCQALLAHDLQRHAEGVQQCTPTIFDRPNVAGAAISLAFNIGVNAYCKSTAAKRFQAGNYRGGCEALGWYTRAGGKVLPGLVRRRQAEVSLCLKGMDA